MAAFAFQNVVPAIDNIRLDTRVAEAEGDHTFLLDAVRSVTGAQVAVVYVFRAECAELKATAARCTAKTRVKDSSVNIGAAMSEWIESMDGPAQGGPGEQAHFEKFPEVFQYQLRSMALLPLRTADGLLGLLTLGRLEETTFDAAALRAANGAARVLTAVLERDTLRHKLSERKVVERAKGILQQQRHITEEQAYLTLRNNSRRRRITMAQLATEIIQAHTERRTLSRLQGQLTETGGVRT